MIVPIGIGFALAVLVVILVLLLRRKLREKYAVLWLVIGLATLLLAIFPGMLVWLAQLLGVQVASNLLFAMSLALLIGVTLHLSWELSTSEEEVRRVAEDVAILRAEVDALTADRASQASADGPSSTRSATDEGSAGPDDHDRAD
ncbi:DUF2304 domain-containing protein [Microbacterium immunditiarum]|uniref:DUF2304 domain-containing protein n=1 Tax=Microbacterium immunditiarum TaxID=337480 RepID=A0A7Y9KKS6_9MICO|nr:DUF2304 domain-containing protein [Microbacterium immunditiarum]NYE21021.1 hypothetical protein [Microbacterium immunditiarum]